MHAMLVGACLVDVVLFGRVSLPANFLLPMTTHPAIKSSVANLFFM